MTQQLYEVGLIRTQVNWMEESFMFATSDLTSRFQVESKGVIDLPLANQERAARRGFRISCFSGCMTGSSAWQLC